MNFKYKAYLQRFFSEIYKGEKINYLFQKYITHTLPISDEDFLSKTESIRIHLDNFRTYSGKNDFSNCDYYEFGTGYDMLIPLVVSLSGFRKLSCIDIRELVFPELINDSVTRLKKLKDKININFTISKNIPVFNDKNFRQVLKDHFSIEYKAPEDARKTSLESESVDFILSNATFEHIPGIHIKDILTECYRILKRGGIMSNAIDYRDHFSFFDNSISVYNYLKYSPAEWERLNPSIMYQNRLRHRDYINFINETGFKILNVKCDMPDEDEIRRFDEIVTDEYFKKNYTKDELIIKSGFIVLQK